MSVKGAKILTSSVLGNVNDVTPIYMAAENGHTEIVKILAPLTDNPNAPDEDGWTPIHRAADNGHIEIVKILVPLTENPNAPDNAGVTPLEITYNAAIKKILMSSKTSTKRNAGAKPSTEPAQKRANRRKI